MNGGMQLCGVYVMRDKLTITQLEKVNNQTLKQEMKDGEEGIGMF